MKSLNQLAHDLDTMRKAFETKAFEAGDFPTEKLWQERATTCAEALKVVINAAKGYHPAELFTDGWRMQAVN